MNDKLFISDPINWPRWPILPIKRATTVPHWPELGCLVSCAGLYSEDGPITVILEPIYTVAKIIIYKDTKYLDKCKQIIYPDIDALLTDRWEVD